ncbi:MAG: DUF4410 domain-containing protein [Acidobacteria bacterium]|nr:DUF4410 domain-containing protein [Acidobacteriota bacterium]
MARSLRILLSLFALYAVPTSMLFAQKGACAIINVYEAEALVPKKTLAIKIFDVGGPGVDTDAGSPESPRKILFEKLEKDLTKTKYFSKVSAVPADETPDTDFVLEGEIIGIHGGSRAGRYFLGGFGSSGQMRVSGRILGQKKIVEGNEFRPIIGDWECTSFMGGSLFGFGSSNESVTRNNAKWISSLLSREIKDLKKIDKLKSKVSEDSDRSPIKGSSKAENRKWREKTDPTIEDYFDEIESFVVKSEQERSRSIDALWMTDACYRAHLNLLPMLKQTAIPSNRQIKRGMLTDLDSVKEFVGQDVYVLIASFTVGSGDAPFLWDKERIENATYLARPGNGELRIKPIRFIDDQIASYIVFNEKRVFKGFSNFRAFHPVILVFPTKLPDGSPFVASSTDIVELHTEVDGRPVITDFHLEHLDIKSMDELSIGGSK